MATQTLSRLTSAITTDKARSSTRDEPGCKPQQKTQTPVYIPPNEFRMKLLKRILSVDGTIDNKALQKLQRSSHERALQANILFQNGDIGTLLSFDGLSDKDSEKENLENEKLETEQLPIIKPDQEKSEKVTTKGEKMERPLRLPPIILPPIYTLTPRALIVRDFSSPTSVPPPISEEDWEDLEDCRYLRSIKKHFNVGKDTSSFLL